MSTNVKILNKEFEINQIASIHYFEYKSDFIFKTELHDYWRLLYVAEGSAEILLEKSNAKPITIVSEEIYLLPPDECYSFKASPGEIPVLFSIGFYCDSPRMKTLCHRIINSSEFEQDILNKISKEAGNAFAPKVNGTAEHTLESTYAKPFGSEQLIELYLELLFIHLIRVDVSKEEVEEVVINQKSDTILFNQIKQYYADHIIEHLNIMQICHEFSIGRSHLQRIFREETGSGAIEYFLLMKVSAAKKMIRENQCSLKETASSLGYKSIPYFSRQFKQITGITPSEYQKSIKASRNNPVYQHVDYQEGTF